MAIFKIDPYFILALMFALFGLLTLLGLISEGTLVCTVLTAWGLLKLSEFFAMKWFAGKVSVQSWKGTYDSTS